VAYKAVRLQIRRNIEGISLNISLQDLYHQRIKINVLKIWVNISVFLFIFDLEKYEGLVTFTFLWWGETETTWYLGH
jgi:hypothetical protein